MNKLPQITLAFWVMKICATTLGDFLTKPHEKGGLDFGTIGSSAVLGGVLLVLVLMATWYQRREPRQALEMS